MTRIFADVKSCYCVNVFMVYDIRIEKTQPDSSDLDLSKYARFLYRNIYQQKRGHSLKP